MKKNYHSKVLVACPISIEKDYILGDWLRHIKMFSYPNYDIYLVDNSHNPNYHKKIRAMGFDVDYVKPEGESHIYMCQCDEMIRQRAIEKKYDAIFHNECDIFAPLDAIERLIAHKQQVVSFPYFIHTGEKSTILIQGVTKMGEELHAYNYSAVDAMRFCDGKLKTVYGCGMGAMLIHYSVFQHIKFRVTKGYQGHADSFFYQDLMLNEIKNYVDTSHICRHENRSWKSVVDEDFFKEK